MLLFPMAGIEVGVFLVGKASEKFWVSLLLVCDDVYVRNVCGRSGCVGVGVGGDGGGGSEGRDRRVECGLSE